MNFNQESTLQKIITQCWEDETFKQTLLVDPVKTIENLIGQALPLEGKKVVVVDQTDKSTIYINVPANPNDVELTDAELEAVAGGGLCFMLSIVDVTVEKKP